MVLSDIDFCFSPCQCKNNSNNDLAAYVRRLVDEGKITTDQRYALSEHLVENHNCPMAMKYHLESKHGISKDYAVGFLWELIYGKHASNFHSTGNGLFNTLYEEAPGTLVIHDEIHGFASCNSFFCIARKFFLHCATIFLRCLTL